MKWEKPQGSTQHTTDGRYCIVQANSQDWVAYELTAFGAAKDLATKPTDEDARKVCEAYEAQLTASHRRSA